MARRYWPSTEHRKVVLSDPAGRRCGLLPLTAQRRKSSESVRGGTDHRSRVTLARRTPCHSEAVQQERALEGPRRRCFVNAPRRSTELQYRPQGHVEDRTRALPQFLAPDPDKSMAGRA